MHPVRFDSVLSVLEHAGRLRWSLLPAGTLWRTPPQRQAARGCSRAVHKLQEALAALRRAGGGLGPVRFGTAIDLGARLSLFNLGYFPGMYGARAAEDAHWLCCGVAGGGRGPARFGQPSTWVRGLPFA